MYLIKGSWGWVRNMQWVKLVEKKENEVRELWHYNHCYYGNTVGVGGEGRRSEDDVSMSLTAFIYYTHTVRVCVCEYRCKWVVGQKEVGDLCQTIILWCSPHSPTAHFHFLSFFFFFLFYSRTCSTSQNGLFTRVWVHLVQQQGEGERGH